MNPVITAYRHSNDYTPRLQCTDANIEQLIREMLSQLGVLPNGIINIQMDGPYGAGEWGIRIFCKGRGVCLA